MEKYTYALILFLTIIICFIASFDKRLRFNRYFSAFLKGVTLVAIPFILWDIWFTDHGVWWFNDIYVLGLRLFGLPIEEILFFYCIPFSCVFTYYCLDRFFDWKHAEGFNNIIVFAMIIIISVFGLLYQDRIYTLVTAIVTVLTLIFLHLIRRVPWISQATFTYLILMLGFFPVNGVLTGFGLESPIVNYNPAGFMGIRMITIPVEDAIYGYAQFLLVIYFFLLFKNRNEVILEDHSK